MAFFSGRNPAKGNLQKTELADFHASWQAAGHLWFFACSDRNVTCRCALMALLAGRVEGTKPRASHDHLANHDKIVNLFLRIGSTDGQERGITRGAPETDQFVIHLGHEHLETGHFLHGQVLADPWRNGLDPALLQTAMHGPIDDE